MTGQQYPTREQIAEPAADELFDLALDGGGTRGDALLRIYRRGVEDVFALLPQPTQECGVCGRQYPADDPHDTCPVCWPGFGEHGQQPTPSAEAMREKPHAPSCDGWMQDEGDCTCRPTAPPGIADMAPGTTFTALWRGHEEPDQFVVLNDGVRCIAPGRWYGGIATEVRYASDRIDPSTIRDVTPPAAPEVD